MNRLSVIVGTLALSMSLAADPPRAPVPADAQKVIARINELRKLAGLEPVSYDAEASAACNKHAKYLVAHDAEIWAKDPLDAHGEKESHSDFSEEGKKAARSSVISWREPLPAIDAWFSGIFHRVQFLDPRLKTVAIGRQAGTKWGVVSLVDVESGVDRKQAWEKSLVMVWPVDKQRGVPLELGNEVPSPIPDDPDRKGGYPVTASFAPSAKVTEAKGSLRLGNGKEVAAWFSSPEKPADARYQRNSLCLITKEALSANATYSVTMEAKVDGEDWKRTWTFTTGK